MSFDPDPFTPGRVLNARQTRAARARLERLDGGLLAAAGHAGDWFPVDRAVAPPNPETSHFRVRKGFVKLTSPVPGPISDRAVPPRVQRPPLTRLMSSQGATLRLELAALANYQALKPRPGSVCDLELPAAAARSDEPAWSKVVATSASQTRGTRQLHVEGTKRGRSVLSSVRPLEAAHLIHVSEGRQRTKQVTFLEETGNSRPGNTLAYRTPTAREPTVDLPWSFITNSWLHLLEDSEIAVLFMIASAQHSAEGFAAFSGEDRLRLFGISRDTYSSGLRFLVAFDLIDVEEHQRHDDGRAVDYRTQGALLHRLRLVPEGLERDALEVVPDRLKAELART